MCVCGGGYYFCYGFVSAVREEEEKCVFPSFAAAEGGGGGRVGVFSALHCYTHALLCYGVITRALPSPFT